MILLLSGPSAVGKSGIWVKAAMRLGFIREVPYTSRAKRLDEENGVEYHFISVHDFHQKIRSNSLLEWDYFQGNYYGTDLSIIERSKQTNIILIAMARIALRIKMKCNDTILMMILSKDDNVLVHRLQQRGYQGDDLVFRCHHALEERAHAPLFDYVVYDGEWATQEQAALKIQEFLETQSIGAFGLK